MKELGGNYIDNKYLLLPQQHAPLLDDIVGGVDFVPDFKRRCAAPGPQFDLGGFHGSHGEVVVEQEEQECVDDSASSGRAAGPGRL